MKERLSIFPLVLLVSFCAALILMLVPGLFQGWRSVLYLAALTFGISLAFGYLLVRYDDQLALREQSDQGFTWVASMNDVRIGTVSDQEHASLKRCALRNCSLAIAQFFNLGKVILTVLSGLMFLIPVGSFWFITITAMDQKMFSELMHWLRSGNTEIIASTMLTYVQVMSVLLIAAHVLAIILGYNCGFRNFYGEDFSRRLRQKLDVPTEGELRVVRLPHQLAELSETS